MKKPVKIVYIVLSIIAAVLLIIGMARLVSANDVIGKVTLSTTGTSYSGETSGKTTTEEFTGEAIIYDTGDYNKDGQINSDDAIYLLMYTQFYDKDPTAYPISQSADINRDGNVNSDDAIYLLMYTQFHDKDPSAYTIEPTTEYD